MIKRRSFLPLLGIGLSIPRVRARTFARRHHVTLDEAHIGDLAIDTRLLDSYGSPPENARAFYLEARAVFAANHAADFSDPAIARSARLHGLALMGGPLLGDLRSDGVTVWLRPAKAGTFEVRVGARVFSAEKAEAGRVLRIEIRGLAPNRPYDYEVRADGVAVARGGFTSAPPLEEKGVFRVCFGSCCHKIGVHNPTLFASVRERKPAAMLLLGDIAVDDRENRVGMHRADYQLRDVSNAWRDLAAHVPLYASWDDHDYFNNDLNGVPKGFSAADREVVRDVWRTNWNNPPAPEKREGVWFSSRVGPVEIIMLDTRSCRDNARRHEYGSYLGAAQMEWVKKTLRNSTAPFKVISSGTMWSDYVTNAKDSWGSWDVAAREELFNQIEDEGIEGVLLISGDRHGARGFRIPRPSGFTLHEFEAATLGGVPGPAGIVEGCDEQLFGYDGKDFIAFGEFTFDTSGDRPRVTFRLISESGRVLEEIGLG